MPERSRVHEPVLVQEVLDLLRPAPGEVFLDLTVGAGGHAARLLEQTGPEGRVLGADRDPRILDEARSNLERFGPRVILAQATSDKVEDLVRSHRIDRIDGVLLDLGLSSFQIDDSRRGFSFQDDGPLDMRMTPGKGPSARDLLEQSSAEELERIFREYGEEPGARRIAQRLADLCRRRAPRTTGELASFIASLVPGRLKGRRAVHPATRIFQALRIAVNDELGMLERTLPRAFDVLAPGGRLAVISFHSGEDRRVKNFFRELRRERRAEVLTPKPLTASAEEVARNPRSRSARLRGLVRLEPAKVDRGGAAA